MDRRVVRIPLPAGQDLQDLQADRSGLSSNWEPAAGNGRACGGAAGGICGDGGAAPEARVSSPEGARRGGGEGGEGSC